MLRIVRIKQTGVDGYIEVCVSSIEHLFILVQILESSMQVDHYHVFESGVGELSPAHIGYGGWYHSLKSNRWRYKE